MEGIHEQKETRLLRGAAELRSDHHRHGISSSSSSSTVTGTTRLPICFVVVSDPPFGGSICAGWLPPSCLHSRTSSSGRNLPGNFLEGIGADVGRTIGYT